MKKKVQTVLQRLKFRKTLQLVWSVSPVLLSVTIFILVIENVLWMGSLYMLKRLVDIVSANNLVHKQQELINAVLMTGAISILYACVKSISTYCSELQATRVNHFIDRRIHEYSVNLDFGFYETPEYLDTLKRAREAGMDKPFAVVSSLLEIFKNGIMMGSVGYILIDIDVMLMPMLSVFVLPILIGRIIFSNKGFALYIRNTELERKAGYLSSLLTMDIFAKEVRTFSIGQYLLSKYIIIKDDLINQQLTLSRKRSLNELGTTAVGTAAFFGVTAYIIFGTLQGRTTVGDIALFLVVFPQAFGIMQTLVGAITRLYHNNMYVSNIFKLFELTPTVESRKSLAEINVAKHGCGLELQNVWFTYPQNDSPSLIDISLNIPAGKIVALVGANGSGKTTLIKLLCKLYEPQQGKIIYGGHDIVNYSAEHYRRNVSVVFQDFVKYNLTVSENIWFGDNSTEPDNARIKDAAKNSGADSFIENFPLKYDTILGRQFEDGHEISIGQWQKIAVARAFYSHSSLVILDEATSALDATAETELFRNFRSSIGQRSALVISHRLSTIRHADYIYVLGDKRIAECGTHDELIALGGRYSDLYYASTDMNIASN